MVIVSYFFALSLLRSQVEAKFIIIHMYLIHPFSPGGVVGSNLMPYSSTLSTGY